MYLVSRKRGIEFPELSTDDRHRHEDFKFYNGISLTMQGVIGRASFFACFGN